MASTLQKLAKKLAIARSFTALHTQVAPNIAVPLFHQVPPRSDGPSAAHSNSLLDSFTKVDSVHSHFTHIYPSFPFGFDLKPILRIGSAESEANDVGSDDSTMIWADSVKKKRKKKMNKHKYKKLRKRLRRQT